MSILIFFLLWNAPFANLELNQEANTQQVKSYVIFDLPRFEGKGVQPRRISFNGRFLLAETEVGKLVTWDFQEEKFNPIQFPEGVMRSDLGKIFVTDNGSLVANSRSRDLFLSATDGTSKWFESAPMRFEIVGPGSSAGNWTLGGTGRVGQIGSIIWSNTDGRIEKMYLPESESDDSYVFRDINPSGIVVGHRWDLGCYLNMDDGVIIEILPNGIPNCWLEHVNSSGVALGYQGNRGFLWDPDGQRRDLNCGENPEHLRLHGISGDMVVLGSLICPEFGDKRQFVVWDGTQPDKHFSLLSDLIERAGEGEVEIRGFKWGVQQSDDGKIIVDVESNSERRTVVLVPRGQLKPGARPAGHGG